MTHVNLKLSQSMPNTLVGWMRSERSEWSERQRVEVAGAEAQQEAWMRSERSEWSERQRVEVAGAEAQQEAWSDRYGSH
jgi:hypothetical protein